jgi:hypothetical protein
MTLLSASVIPWVLITTPRVLAPPYYAVPSFQPLTIHSVSSRSNDCHLLIVQGHVTSPSRTCPSLAIQLASCFDYNPYSHSHRQTRPAAKPQSRARSRPDSERRQASSPETGASYTSRGRTRKRVHLVFLHRKGPSLSMLQHQLHTSFRSTSLIDMPFLQSFASLFSGQQPKASSSRHQARRSIINSTMDAFSLPVANKGFRGDAIVSRLANKLSTLAVRRIRLTRNGRARPIAPPHRLDQVEERAPAIPRILHRKTRSECTALFLTITR